MNLNSVDWGVNVITCETDLYNVTAINGVDRYLGNGSILSTVITNPYCE